MRSVMLQINEYDDDDDDDDDDDQKQTSYVKDFRSSSIADRQTDRQTDIRIDVSENITTSYSRVVISLRNPN